MIRELSLQISLLHLSLPRSLLLAIIQDFALFSGLSCEMVQSQVTQVSKEDVDPADSAALVWWGGVEATAASGSYCLQQSRRCSGHPVAGTKGGLGTLLC